MITFFNISFFNGSVADAVAVISDSVQKKGFFAVATPNPEQIVQAQHDLEFSRALGQFDLYLPDGEGIVWASKRFGTPLKARIAGIEVVEELLKKARREGWNILVVGGEGYEGVVAGDRPPAKQEKFQESATKDSTKRIGADEISVVEILVREKNIFWVKGFDKGNDQHTREVLNWIGKEKPEIVFVALGAPAQEEWIVQYKEQLKKSGVRVMMVVGGAFDVLTGKIKRAPSVVRSLKLEWLWRLLQQPSRWKRQLRLLEFVGLVFREQK